MFSNNNSIQMEGNSESRAKEETHRSVKPPDQYVISYNFEHAHSLNFTHNLLIGVGHTSSKPPRNNLSLPQQPQDKSKLYSIISQPTRVFRSDTRAVATTYQAALLPKRYRNLPNSTTHQFSSASNQNASPDKENFRRVLSKEPKNRQEGRIPILKNVVQEVEVEEEHKRSPYAVKGPDKNTKKERIRVVCNEVTEEQQETNTGQHHAKKITNKQIRSSNERSAHINRNNNQLANRKVKKDQQHSKSPHIRKQNSQHSLSSDKFDKNGQNLSAPLHEQHASLIDLSQEVTPSRQPIETLDFEDNQLPSNELKVKEAEVVKIPSRKEIQDEQLREIEEIARREESGKMKKGYYKVSANKEAQILPFQNNVEPLFTKDAKARKLKTAETSKNMANNTKLEKDGKSLQTGKSNIKANHSQASNTFYSPKHAQNERKPKYFGKEPTNVAVPRKDSTGNKTKINSFQVEAKGNTSYSNAPHSKFSQLDEIKTPLPPSNTTNNNIANRSKASASSDHVGNQRNPSPNSVQLQKDSQFQRNPTQFIKTSHIKSRNQGAVVNRNSETQQVPLKKSANLQAIASGKRNTKVKANPVEIEKIDHVKPNEEEVVEDLTENNQIKGFKIPSKVLQSANNQSVLQDQIKKDSKIKEDSKKNGVKEEKQSEEYQDRQSERSPVMRNSGRSNQSPSLRNNSQIRSSLFGKEDSSMTSRQQQKLKASPSEHSLRKDSLSSVKPVDKRQSRDKQRNMKNWKQAQMAKAQKESRQTKRRESKREPPKIEHKIRKQKKVEPIDLDAAEKDTFGLHSKKKTIKPATKKKQQKISKTSQQNQSFAEKEEIEEIAEQSEEIARNSNSSRSERNFEGEQLIRNEEESLKIRNSGDGEAGLITVNQSMGKISRIGSSRAVPEQTIIPFSNQDLQIGQPLQRLQSLQRSQQDDLETLLEAANAQTPLTQQNTHRSALKSNRQALEKHQSNLQSSGFKQDQHISPQRKIVQNDIEVVEIDADPHNDIILEEHQQAREVNNPLLQTQNRQNEIVLIQNPDIEHKPLLNEELECSQMGQGRQGQIGASRSEDFFQYNIKEISKFNESLNQTNNITKYQSFDRDPLHYTRAPILSLIYPPNTHAFAASSNRLPSTFTHSKPIGHSLLDQTVDLLLSIDCWILERIFEPFSSEKGQTGVWLYTYGQWKLYLVSGQDNFRGVLLRAVQAATNQLGIEEQLENWLKLVSGVRVVRVKSGKKKVLSQLQFSLRKGHCVRAETAENSKWGRRLFAVAQVVVSRQGDNVLQVREGQDVFWVKQYKFREIFDHFLLICTRKSHFWTSRSISPPQNHKAVIALSSSAAAHGSVTLFYPSSKPASLLLYKELQSRVLRFMGKIQQKPNFNGNLYFEFRLHGNYCLFLEAPADCLLAVESTTPLEVGTPQFVRSSTLRNEQCEYVELDKAPARPSMNGKLQQLRERFIRMVIRQ